MNPKERDRRIGTVMLSAAAFWVAELAAFRQFLADPGLGTGWCMPRCRMRPFWRQRQLCCCCGFTIWFGR